MRNTLPEPPAPAPASQPMNVVRYLGELGREGTYPCSPWTGMWMEHPRADVKHVDFLRIQFCGDIRMGIRRRHGLAWVP